MGVGPHGWDVAGRREWLQYPNGVRTTYGYDVRSRLTSLVSAPGGAGVASHGYGLDAVGNRLREQVNGQARQATVNDRNQLTEMAAGGTMLVRGTLDEAGVVGVEAEDPRMIDNARPRGWAYDQRRKDAK